MGLIALAAGGNTAPLPGYHPCGPMGARARERISEQYGEHWHREVKRIMAAEDERGCPLCRDGEADLRPTASLRRALRKR